MPVSIVFADGHPVVRAGLQQWLADANVSLLGEATTGVEAVELVQQLEPEVLLCEILLPEQDGLAVLSSLSQTDSKTRTLFYTSQSNPTYTARAMALGALGLIDKGATKASLLEAIQNVAQGTATWDEQVLRRHTGRLDLAGDIASDLPTLTSRESQVLKQLAFGLSNKEIAQALGISYETAKEHVQHVLRKLGVADRTQAAVWAVRHGLG